MTQSKTLVLLSGLLLGALAVSSGCGWSNAHARGLKLWTTDHSLYRFKHYPFVPGNAVGQCPSECDCPTHFVEPPFFGYHDTCWRRWPDGWVACPVEPISSEEVDAERVDQGGDDADGGALNDEQARPATESPDAPSRLVEPQADATLDAPKAEGDPAAKPQRPMGPVKQAEPPMNPPAKPKEATPRSSAAPKPPAATKPESGPQDRSLPSVPSIFDRQSRRSEDEELPRIERAATAPPHRETKLVMSPVAVKKPTVSTPHPSVGPARSAVDSTKSAPGTNAVVSRRLQRSLVERMRAARDGDSNALAHSSEQIRARPVATPNQTPSSTKIVRHLASQEEPAAKSSVPARSVSYQSTGAPAALPPIPARRLSRPAPHRAEETSGGEDRLTPPKSAKVEPGKVVPAIVVNAERLRQAAASQR